MLFLFYLVNFTPINLLGYRLSPDGNFAIFSITAAEFFQRKKSKYYEIWTMFTRSQLGSFVVFTLQGVRSACVPFVLHLPVSFRCCEVFFTFLDNQTMSLSTLNYSCAVMYIRVWDLHWYVSQITSFP